MPTRKCTDPDFIVAWQAADNAEEVAKATGLTKGSCYARASTLRTLLADAGLPTLKKMPRSHQKDLAALSALITGPPKDEEGDEGDEKMEAE